MLAIGLTGGIGAGKSSVADLLAGRGAVVVDADQIAREVVAPDGPAYGPLVTRFGPSIVAADGTIDRQALAAVAFSDRSALADLNGITHPAIGAVMHERLEALAGTDSVVVVAVPLLTAEHREVLGLHEVVVVDCPTEVAVDRLVRLRGMEPVDARARIAAQPTREARLELADYVIDNSSSYEHLVDQVDILWSWVQRQRARY